MKLSMRILACMLAIIMLLSFVACNSAQPSPTEPTQAPTEDAQKPTEKPTSKPTERPTARPTQEVLESDSKIKNLIIVIGDGMGLAHIEAGQIAEGKSYDFTSWQNSVCNTNSIDSSNNEVLTDSAASATALATGTSTKNGYLGKDKNSRDLDTILDIAACYGKSTGIVTTDYLYGATPAGFSAHCADRNNSDSITLSQIDSDVNYMCGLRNDSFYKKYYTDKMAKNDIFYATDLSDTSSILESEKVFLPIDLENGKQNSVDLKHASAMAIDFLSRNEDGFVLMIEQAYIDKESHSNDIKDMLYRMKSLNDTVEFVTDWASGRDDTAIIVTADHECGGLFSSVEDKYDSSHEGDDSLLYYDWTSTDHTKSMVGIFVNGVEVDFAEISMYNTDEKIRNTDVFLLMCDILKIE